MFKDDFQVHIMILSLSWGEIVCRVKSETSQPVSWMPLGSTTLTLTKQFPMTINDSAARSLAMRLAPTVEGRAGGIINSGFWGIPLWAGHDYELSIYIRDPSADRVRTETPFIQTSMLLLV